LYLSEIKPQIDPLFAQVRVHRRYIRQKDTSSYQQHTWTSAFWNHSRPKPYNRQCSEYNTDIHTRLCIGTLSSKPLNCMLVYWMKP